MSCSKLILHVPTSWVKVHQDFLKDGPLHDEELIGMQELIDWINECGVADETATRNMFKHLNAYVFLRCFYPVLPRDALSKKMFKLCIHFLVGLFLIDDTIEKYNQTEIAELHDSFDTLEEQMCKIFPKFYSIKELQDSMTHLKKKFSIGVNALMMDFVTRSALYQLEEGKTPMGRVVNFRKRMSNAVSLFFQAIFSKEMTGTTVTESEIQWRRSFDAMVFPFFLYTEIFTRAINGKQWPTKELSELYTFGSFHCITINDIYSFHRDCLDSSDSVVKIWLQDNYVADLEEARVKTCKVLDAITQNMYERVEDTKRRYPDSPELHELLKYTCFLAGGMIYVHNTVAPRYRESATHVTVVEIPDEQVPSWMAKKDEEIWAIVRRFEETMHAEKGVMDAIRGDTSASVQFEGKYFKCSESYLLK